MNLRFSRSSLLLLAFPALINAQVNMMKDGIEGDFIVVMNRQETAATGGQQLGTFGARETLSVLAEAGLAASSESAAEILTAGYGSKPKGEVVEVSNIFSKSLTAFEAKMSRQAAERLARLDSVAYVEQNAVVTLDGLQATQDNPTWGIDRVDQRDLPLDNSFVPDGNGSDVYAYIIDTGVQISHNEFGDRATWGINTSGDGDDRDCHGHGTHVAGTVGGTTYGVAKNVNIIAVKVLRCSGSGSTAGVIAGVEWAMNDAADNERKATANLSLGGGFSAAMNAAVKNLQESGVPTVVAAGNDNGSACSKSPASEPAVITVGSTTNTDARSSFSNHGTCLDIFAPGSGITAAWIGSDTATNTISGTSMASPHVCGGAALLLESGMSGAEVTSELLSRATPDKVSDPKDGSPNKLLYVGAVGPTSPPTPAPPTDAPTPCIQSDFELTLTTDNYPGETSWDLVNTCTGQEYGSGEGYGSGTHVENECIPSGEYEFTIYDTWGDGICCSYGSGSYTVKYNGDVVKEGGQFQRTETTVFGTCGSTNPPIAPSVAPIAPTVAPVAPTAAPVAPTAAPVTPTAAPVAPTAAPIAPTASPVAPTTAPAITPTADAWETIYEDDFEEGMGQFVGNNKRFDVTSTPPGDWSLRIKRTQALRTKWFDVRSFSKLNVKFWFYADGMEDGDKFKLRVKFNQEQGWTNVGVWEKGNNTFVNNEEWYEGMSNIDVPDGKRRMRFMFKGNSNQGNDKTYIDDVVLEGRSLSSYYYY